MVCLGADGDRQESARLGEREHCRRRGSTALLPGGLAGDLQRLERLATAVDFHKAELARLAGAERAKEILESLDG